MRSIFTCCYTHHGVYSIVEGIIKSPNAVQYEVDDDYDFGAIRVNDLITDMYIKGTQKSPGIIQIQT